VRRAIYKKLIDRRRTIKHNNPMLAILTAWYQSHVLEIYEYCKARSRLDIDTEKIVTELYNKYKHEQFDHELNNKIVKIGINEISLDLAIRQFKIWFDSIDVRTKYADNQLQDFANYTLYNLSNGKTLPEIAIELELPYYYFKKILTRAKKQIDALSQDIDEAQDSYLESVTTQHLYDLNTTDVKNLPILAQRLNAQRYLAERLVTSIYHQKQAPTINLSNAPPPVFNFNLLQPQQQPLNAHSHNSTTILHQHEPIEV
jgi:hypothetical protein